MLGCLWPRRGRANRDGGKTVPEESPRQGDRAKALDGGGGRRAPEVSDMPGITGVLTSMMGKLSVAMPGNAFAKER